MKKIVIALSVCCAVLTGGCIYSSAIAYRSSLQNDALRTIVKLGDDEIRILTYELREEKQKPSYEDGKRDMLIKMGGPQNPGAFQDGYDAAVSLLANTSYAEGYHNCILQFAYQKQDTSRYLVPEPKSTPIPGKQKEIATELSNNEILP